MKLALGLFTSVAIGVYLWYDGTREKTVSRRWLQDEHRWATDRSAWFEGVTHTGKFNREEHV